MRLSRVLPILACVAAAGCSTVGDTLSTDVWLCAYQLGNRYRDETAKPDVIKYDTVVYAPVRHTTLTYLLPVEGQPPSKRTMTCEAAPWGFGVVAEDGVKLPEALPNRYPGDAADLPTVQGPVADKVRNAVQQT